jgi:WD40 repeat protein
MPSNVADRPLRHLAGTRVATGSDDHSARVLDATTGAQLTRLDHERTVLAVAFAPDGTRLATGSRDGAARVFEVDRDLLLRRVLELMPRPLSPSELRQYSLPWNCRHVEQWCRQRAVVGDTNAARHLVALLLSRLSHDAVAEAETWCRSLTERGEADLRNEMGAIAVRREAYDEAVTLWTRAAQDGSTDAALNLASVQAVDGRVAEAQELLRVIAKAGRDDNASAYAAITGRTATPSQIRQVRAAAASGNTSAGNFLGLAALNAGDTTAAGDHWARAADAGDWVAPLLLTRLNQYE